VHAAQARARPRGVLVYDNSGLAVNPPVHPDGRAHTLVLDQPGVYPPTVRAPPVADGEGARLMRAHRDKYVASGVLELAPAGTPAYARAFRVWNGRKWRLVTALQDVNRYTRFDGPPLRDLLTRDIRQSSAAHAGMTCFSSGDVLEAFTVVRNDEFTARICALATPFGVFLARRDASTSSSSRSRFRYRSISCRRRSPRSRSRIFDSRSRRRPRRRASRDPAGARVHVHIHDLRISADPTLSFLPWPRPRPARPGRSTGQVA
jgi:hypothetical protein